MAGSPPAQNISHGGMTAGTTHVMFPPPSRTRPEVQSSGPDREADPRS